MDKCSQGMRRLGLPNDRRDIQGPHLRDLSGLHDHQIVERSYFFPGFEDRDIQDVGEKDLEISRHCGIVSRYPVVIIHSLDDCPEPVREQSHQHDEIDLKERSAILAPPDSLILVWHISG
jgi:hypothetical protein